MSKILKIKLALVFAAGAIVVGVSIGNLSMLHNVYTATKDSQDSNIKNDMTVDLQNTYKSDSDKDLSSLPDANNSQYNDDNATATRSQLKDVNTENPIIINEPTALDATSNTSTENQTSTNVSLEENTPSIHYDRTTSIYTDDYTTLLRVEYYSNNKLTYYSEIEQYDAATKSYTEKIYQCNLETNIDPLIRTDIYVNGNLIKSY